MSTRDRAIKALRELAPGYEVSRVWGRMEGSTPDKGPEANAWAADIEDVVDVVLAVVADSKGRGNDSSDDL